MEIIVNLPGPALLNQYATIAVQFNEKLVEERYYLPLKWNSRPSSSAIKNIGDLTISNLSGSILDAD
jgi:hypothetical protein